GGRDNLFFALGNLVVVLIAASATAGRFLRLRIPPLEGFRLHEEHVGAGGGVRIARGGVQAHQIPRRQLEIFQRDRGGAGGRFHAFALQQGNGFLGSAVHRVVQAQIVE